MTAVAKLVRRHFLWLLLATYAIAYLLPGPGALAARIEWSPAGAGAIAVRLPMLLVGVLVLNAALGVDFSQLRGVLRRWGELAASLAAVWIGPAVVVIAASFLFALRGGPEGTGLLLGMILVAAMPVANSSAGWSQQSGGSLNWALALVVLSIMLCPLVTPGLIGLLGMSLSTTEAAGVEQFIQKFSGVTFILWVLAPTIVGMVVRRIVGGEKIDRLRPALHIASAATILALNYLNGSLVLHDALREPSVSLLLAALAGSLSLCLSGLVGAQLIAMLFGASREDRLALKFALSMKHTGLALGLSGAVLADSTPEATLLIILTTPVQHLLAAIVGRSGTADAT